MEEKNTEQKILFNLESDLTVLAVKDEETQESIMEISGYGLQVNVNHDKIHGVEDLENLLEGIKNMYRQLILSELLDNGEKSNEK